MSASDRARMVVDATLFGIRPTARTYGVAPATVHKWVHHVDYWALVARCRIELGRLAARLRDDAAQVVE